MSNLIPQSALFQPIAWQGQQYFTSQYFHRQYLTNSQNSTKYQRHSDFLRIIRGMEAYAIYVQQGDIVELRWSQVKSSSTQDLRLALTPVFEARGYQELYLLNATAQVALSHHLDDELSKQLSVATNTSAARQLTSRGKGILPEEHAARAFAAHLQVAALLGCPVHIGQQEAVKMVRQATGLDYRALLQAAPGQDDIQPEAKALEPKDLAKELGIPSAYGLNKALEQIGWQVKKIGGGWEATPAGLPHATEHAWTSEHSTKSGYNLKWNVEAVTAALKAAVYEFPVAKEQHP